MEAILADVAIAPSYHGLPEQVGCKVRVQEQARLRGSRDKLLRRASFPFSSRYRL